MQCKNCSQPFTIYPEDRAFYAKLGLAEPTHCPDCRAQRRMALRNERVFYSAECQLCHKKILSNYSPDKPYKVYCRDCWYSDKWDPTAFGREFDFSRPFFSQYDELLKAVPRAGTVQAGGNIVNSDYCNYLGDAKNSYLCYGSIFIENCLYGNPYYSKDCVDSLLIRDCELCYECVTSEHLYSCCWCQDCFDSNNLFYCYDCRGCSECIGCAGLRNVHHQIFNRQYSEADYEKFKAELNWCNPGKVAEVKAELEKNKLKLPRRYLQGLRNVRVSGDYINESKNCRQSFDAKRCEDSAYSAQVIDLKDCYDNNYTENNELCCDYIASWKNYRAFYSFACYQCNDIYYSDWCDSSKNLFGCSVMRKRHFSILNKEYTEKEYNQLVPKIIEHLKKTGEWGEFFPIQISPFAYNETVANDYFPLSEAEVKAKGWAWKQKDAREYQKQVYQTPAEIKAVPDDILNEVLACVVCGKNYKIIKPELGFYRQFGLPIPRKCPDCRHLDRMQLRNPRHLYQRKCDQCGTEIETTYSPERPEKVYCEECYRKEIY
ncbi:MAG: zinc-ribbon domain containing protein [Patescibacteria group bacterium]